MDPRIELFIDSDNDIRLSGLQVARTREYVNDATVTFTLRAYSSGVVDGAVIGGIENEPMYYQTGSRGLYIGVLPADAGMTVGTLYIVDISVTSSGAVKRIAQEAKAVYSGTIRR